MEAIHERELSNGIKPTDELKHCNTPVYKQPYSQTNLTSVTEKDRLLTNSYHKSSDHQAHKDEFGRLIQNGERKRPRPDVISFQPQKPSIDLLPHHRLVIPTKSDIAASSASDVEPLVVIEMDDDSSEEEFQHPRLQRFPKNDITRQLMQDGYNLDLQPDDNDLDLIPPKPKRSRCSACCSSQLGCGIQ